MFSARKKRQSNRTLLSQIDDFDQNVIIGNAINDRQEITTVNDSTADQEFTVGNSDGSPAVNENVVNVKTLEGFFNERIDKEMSNFVDTVEDRIQNAILTAIDSINTPRIEFASRSINAFSGGDATSGMASSERGENFGITAPFENVSERNKTLHVLNTNDETRNKTLDKVSELSVPDTHFYRQPQIHHKYHCRSKISCWKNICKGSKDKNFPPNFYLYSLCKNSFLLE